MGQTWPLWISKDVERGHWVFVRVGALIYLVAATLGRHGCSSFASHLPPFVVQSSRIGGLRAGGDSRSSSYGTPLRYWLIASTLLGAPF